MHRTSGRKVGGPAKKAYSAQKPQNRQKVSEFSNELVQLESQLVGSIPVKADHSGPIANLDFTKSNDMKPVGGYCLTWPQEKSLLSAKISQSMVTKKIL